jgi:hypothetical protein
MYPEKPHTQPVCMFFFLQLDPEHRRANVALWEGLAKARSKLKQTAGAIEAWDAVLQLAPDNLEAHEGKIRYDGVFSRLFWLGWG